MGVPTHAPSTSSANLTRPAVREIGAPRWAGLAIGSLVGAGLLSLLLVIGRLPPFDTLFTDEGFFHRALVVHVDLAIVVWFLAFTVGLYHLLPSSSSAPPWCRVAPHVAFSGLLMMVAATFIPEAAPILANYIPVLDHPLFLAGLLAFGAGILLAVLGPRLAPSTEIIDAGPIPPEARPGLRVAAIAIILAALTLLSSWWSLSPHQPAEVYYERLVWGCGHVLQFASVAAMVAVWLSLLRPVLGRAVLNRKVTTLLFALLVTPLFVAPLLADTNTPESRMFFTRLMELAIFPVVSVFLIASLVAIVRFRRTPEGAAGPSPWRDPRTMAFAASGSLTALGFVLGAMIDGSNTLVPAHYHASIGAVTAAFMGATHAFGRHFGLAPYTPRGKGLARWQPIVFGVGQMIFAAGFAIAGAAGMVRKTYGTEQVAVTDAMAKTVGLVVMGIGGVIAVVGGLVFLALVLGAWRRARASGGPRNPAPSFD